MDGRWYCSYTQISGSGASELWVYIIIIIFKEQKRNALFHKHLYILFLWLQKNKRFHAFILLILQRCKNIKY